MKLEINETKYIYVDAKSWYSGYPNVKVSEGEVYNFKVNPLLRWSTKWLSYDANGTVIPFSAPSKRRFNKAPYHSLCATIDRAEELHFKVGLWLQNFKIKQTGELQFFANKPKDLFDRGSGHLVVEIARVK